MKMALLLSVVSLGFAITSVSVNAAEQTQSYSVEKMTCALCPVTVKKAIEKVDGVTSVKVDFDTKTATVTFDDDVATSDAVAEASTNAGYPAVLIQTGS
jgi:mercuric ion binding protein